MICNIGFIAWRCIVICAIALLITTMSTTLAALFICSCVALIGEEHPQRNLHNPTGATAGLIALMDEMFAGMTSGGGVMKLQSNYCWKLWSTNSYARWMCNLP
ncbi:hypothetical protein MJK71_23050 [Escherichia coli]|nr:hypothetical protein MJK71_23050 [Escherichia coli]